MHQRSTSSNKLSGGAWPVYFFGVLLVLGIFSQSTLAHNLDHAVLKTQLQATEGRLDFTTEAPIIFTYGSADEQQKLGLLADIFTQGLVLEYQGQACAVKITGLEEIAEPQQSKFRGTYTCPKPVTTSTDIVITNNLFAEMFHTNDHFVTVTIGGQSREVVFSHPQKKDLKAEDNGVTLGREQTLWTVIKRFTGLGTEHILFGLDHVLFILMVILMVRPWKQIILLVTSFTIAHSITLILAGLGILSLTARVVEPLIALSIVVMAARNLTLLRKGDDQAPFKERLALTLVFGLVHGLGFAGALAEIDIPRTYFLPALVTFNLGVELGQLLLIALFVPWLKLMVIESWRARQRILQGICLAVGAIALFWFIERVIQLWF